MPYRHGFSEESIHHNIALFVREGYPQDQAVAMALDIARKAWRREHPRGNYPTHLKGMRGPRKRRRKARRNRADSDVYDYRVAYLGYHARRTHVDGLFTLAQATKISRQLKRRGMTTWIETRGGVFVPIAGQRKRPMWLED